MVQRFLSFCLLMVVLVSCTTADEDDLKKKVVYKGPISQSNDILTLYSDSARLQIKLAAPVQWQYENGDGVYPKGINMTFYDKAGRITNTVRADYGKYDKQKDAYFARGNVIVKNEIKNEILRTEELHWDKLQRKFFTEKFVTIQTENQILKGHGMTSDQEFSNPRIHRMTGTIILDETK